ncbi:MAG: ATP-dependent zinc metalloprotease FtsH [Planctomycetota bacterium]
MEDNRQNEQEPENRPGPSTRNLPFLIMLMVLAFALFMVFSGSVFNDADEISRHYFLNLLEGKDYDSADLEQDPGVNRIQSLEYWPDTGIAKGVFTEPPLAEPKKDSDENYIDSAIENRRQLKKKFTVQLSTNEQLLANDIDKVEARGVLAQPRQSSDLLGLYTTMIILFSLGLLLFMFLSLRRSQNQMMGGGGFLSNFSRSPAKKYEAEAEPVTFKDVAGLEGVKADLQEIVEFLKDPGKFKKLGGRVPKGVLLVGPPGTGKTLLARAVAGEAEVPYFSVNGSEFIQMFVGVGASRVRDLFSTAKSQSPAIIFIDEIDAVGRQRGAGLGGGHDEREQTLNQILGEMDGFQGSDSVIILAATNRPDILDPALLRPGRFDRHVTVSRPTLNGRLKIFKVHVRDVPLDKDVDLEVMAQATAGMTGADIQNLVNEAALWAARLNKSKVQMEDFYYAHDKVLMGAKREEVLTKKEKERTAYHEVGHTLAAWYLEGANPVHKVTIIPRGQALGVTQMVPDEDKMNMSENEIRDHLVVLLAGRAAEQLIYDELTVGAENDLERATSMARRMVTHWGMSSELGPVSYKMTDEDPFLGREMQKSRQFSEHTMERIDDEVTNILRAAAASALELLKDKKGELEKLTHALIEHEELDRNQIEEQIGKGAHSDKPALFTRPDRTEMEEAQRANGSGTDSDDSAGKSPDSTGTPAPENGSVGGSDNGDGNSETGSTVGEESA